MTFNILALGFGGPELIAILAVVVLLFGGTKLPGLARSLGRSMTEFKRGKQEGSDLLNAAESKDTTPTDSSDPTDSAPSEPNA